MEETNKNSVGVMTDVPKEKDGIKTAKSKTDKLTALKIKQEKAAAAVEKAAKKAKAIEEAIAAEQRKRRDKDIKQLDDICRNMKIELADVIALIGQISENQLTVKDISEMIGGKKENG
ncbi:MAG: hypothetical protein NC120_04960 [Ruminococcus sp.]|nr:hypothetical protein [Ruminococcus sp.]